MLVLRRRVAGMLAAVVPLSVAVTLTPATAQAVTPPSIVITSPAAHASVAGTTAITFNAALDPTGSATIASFQLVVDGTPYGGTLGCQGGAVRSCSQQLLWEATGAGGHNLQVRMTSSSGTTLTSAAVAVTVAHPHATVTISSPLAGATVSGPYIQVATHGALDNPDAGDQVEWMQLLVDSVPVDLQSCDEGSTSTADCAESFGWDSTTATPGSHTIIAELTTRSGGVWDSVPVTVTVVAYVSPTVVVVTGPSAGSTVQGTVSVTATGTVTSPSDEAQGLALLVDDNIVDWYDCPPASHICTGTLSWSAGTALGTHAIAVDLETDEDYAQSAPVTVTVAATPPTFSEPVAWTYFSSGPPHQPVYGPVVLTADGRIDAHSGATAVDLQVYVDHQAFGAPTPCAASSPDVCSAAVSWQTRGLVGSHVVQTRFDTSAGSVMSEQVTYDVEPYNAGQTSISVQAGAQSGRELVFGRVASKTAALAGAPVNITVAPAVGNPVTYLTTADQLGAFSLNLGKPFPLTSKVTASLPADYGSATSSYVQEAYVTLACHLPTRIAHGKKTTISCTTSPVARNGGKVTLYFKYLHAGIHVLGHSLLKNGRVTISFTTEVKGARIQLWAKLSRTRTAAPAYSRTILARIA